MRAGLRCGLETGAGVRWVHGETTGSRRQRSSRCHDTYAHEDNRRGMGGWGTSSVVSGCWVLRARPYVRELGVQNEAVVNLAESRNCILQLTSGEKSRAGTRSSFPSTHARQLRLPEHLLVCLGRYHQSACPSHRNPATLTSWLHFVKQLTTRHPDESNSIDLCDLTKCSNSFRGRWRRKQSLSNTTAVKGFTPRQLMSDNTDSQQRWIGR